MNFQPAVYEHAANLIHKSPWSVSRDVHLLVEAHTAAYQMYQHIPISVGIDIYNLEAEAYGAVIKGPAGNNIPAVSRFPATTCHDILKIHHFNPQKDGRIPLVLKAGKMLRQKFPQAQIKIPVSGPFSLAANLMGLDNLLLECVLGPQKVKKVLFHLVEGQLDFCKEIKSTGLDATIFESASAPPLLSPKLFKDIELPSLKYLLDQVTEIFGHQQALILGGDTAPILSYLLECNPGYLICPFETNQTQFMEKMKKKPEVMVRINMDPHVFIGENLKAVFQEANRVVQIAGSRKNVCVGSGALPFEANPAIVLEIKNYINSK
jgi:uroporphyrinogen decarboxylase